MLDPQPLDLTRRRPGCRGKYEINLCVIVVGTGRLRTLESKVVGWDRMGQLEPLYIKG